MKSDSSGFYESLPIVSDFARAVRQENYAPLPDDWVIGFSDVVASTEAVANGRYKAVNMIGAGVIAAVSNALGRRPFPFVFGGDGASFSVSATGAPAAERALAAIKSFSHAEFEIDLRAGAAPVSEIRAAGHDVRVARFGASRHAAYAMFAGGGIAWLESEVKRGRYAVAPAPTGVAPDLSGLSCRWKVAAARHGVILSVIVVPRGDDPRFPALIDEVVSMAASAADGGRPVTVESLSLDAPGETIGLEALAGRASGKSRLRAGLTALKGYLTVALFRRFMLKAGSFDMATYMDELVANADFRKFDDGLRMTLDCSEAFAEALETRLAAAEDFADFGVFRQAAAQVTCFVPFHGDRGHLHFVDGAGGGYTMAAAALKARRSLKAKA